MILSLLWVLFGMRSENGLSTSGLVSIYYDNSTSSSLIESEALIEQGINSLLEDRRTLVFHTNNGRRLLDENFSFDGLTGSVVGLGLTTLFERLNYSGVSTQYLFADFQSTYTSILKELMQDSVVNYHLVLIDDLNEIRNVSVDSLYLRPNPDNLSELSIIADFNIYNMPSGSIVVKLMQGNRQLSSIVMDVSELDEVQFDISKDMSGEFEIVIDGDEVLYDNIFHFVVGEKAKLLINILASKSRRVLSEVYKNESLFDVTIQDIGNLDYESVIGSDLLIIADQYSLPENLSDQLKNATYVIFPSDSVNIDSYETFIGLRLETLVNNDLTEINVDSKHPLFSGVFDKEIAKGLMPQETTLFSVNGDFESIIGFRDGNPFLLLKDDTYLFNVALKKSPSGFQSNALFLPILYQIAFSSVGSIDRPYYYPGDQLVLNSKASDIPIKIRSANYEVIPSFNSNGTEMILEVPDNLEPGAYVLMQGSDTLKSVAVNLPKSESVMRAPEFEELRDEFSDMQNVTVSQLVDGQSNEVFASGDQSSLWKYALILVVFLILTETALHRYLK